MADIGSVIGSTMRRQLDLASVGAAFIGENPAMSSSQLQRWTDALHFDESYPEVVAMGVVQESAARCQMSVVVSFGSHVSSVHDMADLCRSELAHPGSAGGFVADAAAGSVQFVAWAPMSTSGAPTAGVRRIQPDGLVVVVIDVAAMLDRSLRNHPAYWASLTDAESSSPQIVSGVAADNLGRSAAQLPAGWTVLIGAPAVETGLFADGRALVGLLVGIAVSVVAGWVVFVLVRARSKALRTAAERGEQMRQQSLTDSLTGLPNRAAVMGRITALTVRCQAERGVVAVLCIDIDDFKHLNDSFGHAAGDQILAATGERLWRRVRAGGAVGRIGGDEFVVVLYGSVLDVAPEVVAQRILEDLRMPYVIDVGDASRSVTSSASIGIAQGCSASSEDLLRDADLALYEAKAAGKDRFSVSVPGMHDAVRQRLSLGIDLQAAIDLTQFELWYQPIYHLDDLSVVGAEALLRWNHPRLGTVPPDRFVPILEHTRQIVEVGRWVLMQSCCQTAQWRRAGHSLGIAVNVSARQLDDPHLVAHVLDALHRSGLDPSALTIEVTETALVLDPVASAAHLRDIKALGVRIAIDDFGSGYSSLAYLRDFPVDSLKLDRCFVQAIHSSPESDALVRALANLGQDLGLQTVAEGIETIEQLDELRRVRVNQAQGYLLAHPLSAETFEANILGSDRAHVIR